MTEVNSNSSREIIHIKIHDKTIIRIQYRNRYTAEYLIRKSTAIQDNNKVLSLERGRFFIGAGVLDLTDNSSDSDILKNEGGRSCIGSGGEFSRYVKRAMHNGYSGVMSPMRDMYDNVTIPETYSGYTKRSQFLIYFRLLLVVSESESFFVFESRKNALFACRRD